MLRGLFRRRPQARLESAARSRRLMSRMPGTRNINTVVSADGDLTRRRSREIVLSNPLANGACEAWVANAVGCGIKPSPLFADADAKRALQALWREWTDEADSDGLTDFYGLQALVGREVWLAGECFIRLRARRPEDGLSVPLQLQLLQSEMLPLGKTETAPGGNPIRCGIEFDRIARKTAYWFLRRHPGDQTVPLTDPEMYTRVPADQVIHICPPLEAGQLRGLPRVTPALLRLHQMDQYMDAQVERQKIAALFVGFLTQPDPTAPPLLKEGAPEEDGSAPAPLQPATFQKLLPGEDVKFSEPPGPGADFDPFLHRVSLELAAGLGLPYSVVTGDLRAASYGSQRAGMVEFRRRMEQFQHAVLVFQMCRPIWRRWLDDAVLSGVITLPGYATDPRPWRACKWIPPRWAWIDPLKDRQAEKLAVDAGFKARADVVEEEGYDVEEVDERIAADRAREADLGLSFAPAARMTTPADEPAPPQT